MDSFDVVNTELVIVELLTLVGTMLVLALLFFLVRRAMRGGGPEPGRPREKRSTGATRTGRWRGRSI
jgi:hypothetical protein